MDVETLAVNTISSMIATCPHLKPFITVNDKTPFTDGHIDLHSGLQRSKADWQGRVPVQVKGRTRHSKKRLSKYSVERSDLVAFRRDSGVLYFVVTVDPAATNLCVPYYALLSPFKIDSILEGVPSERDRIQVSLTKLPSDPGSIERIVALALKTREQNTATGFDPVLFEHAQSFTLHTASDLSFDGPITLVPDDTDFAFVLNTVGGLAVPLPGELRILPPTYVPRVVDLQVRSGAITYDGATIKQINDHCFEADISEGLTLSLLLETGRQSTDVSLTLERTLAGRLKSLEFYTSLLDTKMIELNGKPSPLAINRSDKAPWLREHLRNLRSLSELFDRLGVDTKLVDLDQIDEFQARQLNVLHRAFVQDKEITNAALETSVALQQVGPWQLMFLISPGSETDKWRLTDPFALETRRQFRWSAGDDGPEEAMPLTAYDLVGEERLGTVLNLRLGSIVSAYEAFADFPSTYALASQRVVALIAAADDSNLRRNEFLDAAASLNDWLANEEGEQPRHLINRGQISWRQGTFSDEQRNQIRGLKREIARSNADDGDQLEMACALLLGERDEVEYLIQQLPEEQLLQMKAWPIWRLHDEPDPGAPAV